MTLEKYIKSPGAVTVSKEIHAMYDEMGLDQFKEDGGKNIKNIVEDKQSRLERLKDIIRRRDMAKIDIDILKIVKHYLNN